MLVDLLTSELKQTIVMLLAGGQGERLYPLTRDRAKPAVPFGGIYRIIDFTLSNCVNSGLRRIHVLTQYKSSSLQRHLQHGWSFFRPEWDEYLNVVPPQQRTAPHWYVGTADAVFQNIYTLEEERPAHVLIVAGDHVYKMNYVDLLQFHLAREAEVTIACVAAPVARAAGQFGVAQAESNGRIVAFSEKPDRPSELPGRPRTCLCSMGVYVFETGALVREVSADAKTDSTHDFGRDIIPGMLRRDADVFAYEFRSSDPAVEPYWRDIGTIDAYWSANFDLVQPLPVFNLYDREWPIHTHQPQAPPAKTVFNELPDGRRGMALNSLVSQGCIVSGAAVEESILSPNVYVHSGAAVRQSVLMDEAEIGRGAQLYRVIVDKHARIPEGAIIGYDPVRDRARFTVSDGGVVVVSRGIEFEPN
jgi:glucose-1-phosphate adenylyltransferase